jgi:hypothetical protein
MEGVIKRVDLDGADPPCSQPDGTCFLHLRFHPQDIPRRDIQQLFSAISFPTFQEVGFDVHRMIVACSRAPNISNNV